ncbi:adenine phosphoribosyltransferase [[Eubacterium] yurii subsp. margaretiae ATCC 43715]|nr:adenine phosphoribosyltransferase [[Eubacterium] yurii subsp. margaretiae ATCC 43715]
MDLRDKIRQIPNFPKEGIVFRDITTLIKDKDAFKQAVDEIVSDLKDKKIDYIVGPEARGFLMGSAVAYALGVGFVPVRKKGKLPGEVIQKEYDLEYGTDILEIHKDAIEKGSNVAIVDDLLATGGTVFAVSKLLEDIGANVSAMEFLIELTFLNPREKLKKYHINSLVKYDEE